MESSSFFGTLFGLSGGFAEIVIPGEDLFQQWFLQFQWVADPRDLSLFIHHERRLEFRLSRGLHPC
jgi:hypothetical protein